MNFRFFKNIKGNPFLGRKSVEFILLEMQKKTKKTEWEKKQS